MTTGPLGRAAGAPPTRALPPQFGPARAHTLAALSAHGPAPVGHRLVEYYDRSSGEAGDLLAALFPNHPYELTATDLHAIALHGFHAGPALTRRLLDSGAHRSAALAALRDVPQVELVVAGEEAFVAMAWLHDAVATAVGSASGSGTRDPLGLASVLCARKRPYLFPVLDEPLREVLGIGVGAELADSWRLFRALIGDADVIHACDDAINDAMRRGGTRRLAVDHDRLRVLDAALRTYARPA